jgi:ferritin-like metal-binding protein YciE
VSTGEEKIVRYLDEARATEEALVRTLQAHVAMTPRGDYRKLLERHLRETEQHRDRVDGRLDDLGEARGMVETGVGALQSFVGEVLVLGKLPLDVVRGESGEEKLVKNAKDECATEALEIATYRALEVLARHVGDTKTAELAERIRGDEERMLEQLHEQLPALTEAAAKAEVVEPSYDVSTTGAADAARDAAERGRGAVDAVRRRVRDTAREALERLTATARDAMRQIQESVERGQEAVEATARTAIAGVETTAKEAERAVRETAEAARHGAEETVEEAERQTRRTAGAARRDGGEPWAGYDKQSVTDINKRLGRADQALARRVRDYERRHKNRATVVDRAKRKA